MSLPPMNRQARKALAANARALAVKLSRSMMDYDGGGRVVPVAGTRAQAVLCRAFERMLRAGGAPQLLRLSEAEAAAFPRGGRVPAEDATPWLAVGIDRAGLATYAMRWLGVSHLEPMAQREVAEAALFLELAVECQRPGFPVAGHA